MFYANSLIIPIAPAIRATGISKKNPPTKMRQMTKIGIAKTIRIVAMIFVIPQVILNARLIAFTSNTTASIDMIISVNYFSSLIFLCFY